MNDLAFVHGAFFGRLGEHGLGVIGEGFCVGSPHGFLVGGFYRVELITNGLGCLYPCVVFFGVVVTLFLGDVAGNMGFSRIPSKQETVSPNMDNCQII